MLRNTSSSRWFCGISSEELLGEKEKVDIAHILLFNIWTLLFALFAFIFKDSLNYLLYEGFHHTKVIIIDKLVFSELKYNLSLPKHYKELGLLPRMAYLEVLMKTTDSVSDSKSKHLPRMFGTDMMDWKYRKEDKTKDKNIKG